MSYIYIDFYESLFTSMKTTRKTSLFYPHSFAKKDHDPISFIAQAAVCHCGLGMPLVATTHGITMGKNGVIMGFTVDGMMMVYYD